MDRFYLRFTLGTFSFLLLLSGSAAPYLLQDREQSERRFVAWAGRELSKPEGRPHDLRALAGRLGFDPTRIFAFVQKEIRFDPYPGFQRGPAGVLASGAGNAADQSFLLRDLLKAAGYPARIVRGRLPTEDAGRMVDAAFARRPSPRFAGPFGEPAIENLKEFCAEIGLSFDEASRRAERGTSILSASWDEVRAIAARESKLLASDLVGEETAGRKIRDEMAGAVATHYWVQYKPTPQAAWSDLDPCQKGALKPDGDEVHPSSVADRLSVILTAERKIGDKRESVRLCEVQTATYRLLENPLEIVIQPTGDLPRKSPAELCRTLAAAKQFQAIVRVGEECYGSKVFGYDGTVSAVKGDGRLEAAEGMGGGVRGGFGGAFGGGEEKPKGELLSLAVEFALLRGDAKLWSQTRAVLEERHRDSWCPVLSWSAFLQTHEVSREFVRSMRLQYRVQNDELIRKAREWTATGKGFDALLASPYHHYPLDLLDFCLARQAFVEERKGTLFFDRPNLFLSTQELRPWRWSYGIDLVENGALVLEGDHVDRAATTALGIFDTALEQALVRRTDETASADGTISRIERQRLLGATLKAFPCDAEALRGAGLPESDADWIMRHGDPSHRILCAPGGPSAWWSYETSTGRIVGRISGGRGGCSVAQGLSEYVYVAAILVGAFLGVLWVLTVDVLTAWGRSLLNMTPEEPPPPQRRSNRLRNWGE